MVDRTTMAGAPPAAGLLPTAGPAPEQVARSLGILTGPEGQTQVDQARLSALLNGAERAWSPASVLALLGALQVPKPGSPPPIPTGPAPAFVPPTPIGEGLGQGPLGVYLLRRQRGSEKVALKAFDQTLTRVLRQAPADTQVVLCGFEVEQLAHSQHAARILAASAKPHDLPKVLAEHPASRILIVSAAPFSEVVRPKLFPSTAVQVESLEHLLQPQVFSARSEDATNHTSAKNPVLIQTYAEFPQLLSAYLERMDRQWSVLKLLQRFSPDDPTQAPIREALLNHLRGTLDQLEERTAIVPGLPAMNLEDLKLSIANLLTLAQREASMPPVVAQARSNAVATVQAQPSRLQLDVAGLPEDLARRVDSNNLLLAAVATEARCAVANRVRAAVEGMVDGVHLLGSAAWGANFGVQASSDVDLEVMLGAKDLQAFAALLPANFDRLSGSQALELVRRGQGRVFAMLSSLLEHQLLVGNSDPERAQAALTAFGRFATLRSAQLDPPDPALAQGLADYLSFKVQAKGVDVSVHVIPTEVFTKAASLDLVANAQTRLLSEVRVGGRKQVREGSKERTDLDHTAYPDKRSFDGSAINFRCDVRAIVRQGQQLRAFKPSELAAAGLSEKDVYAWVTPTPLTVVEDGRLYHGLFQDKALWGELSGVRNPALSEAKATLLSNLVDRFAFEVEQGMVQSRDASILKLSARLERIPEFTKKEILERLKRDQPGTFLKLADALRRIGSKELARLDVTPPKQGTSADGAHLSWPQGLVEQSRAFAARGLGAVAELTTKLDRLAGTKITDAFGLPDAEVVFLIKPLGMQLGVEQRVRDFIRDNGGTVVDEYRGVADTLRVAEHYRQHADKPVFGDMVSYFAGEDVCALKVRLNSSKIDEVRELLGSYKPKSGTLRDELIGTRWKSLYQATGVIDNGLHISDSKAEGARESKVWFGAPPIVSERPATQQAHRQLWKALTAIDPSVQFAGSQYNGLAIAAKKDDLDYRVLADDVDTAAAQVSKIPGVSFRREAIDAKSGERFLLYEAAWEGGKADIAVVPKQHYRSRVSAAVLANFLPDTWKAEVREIKDRWRVDMEAAKAEHGHGTEPYRETKGQYEAAKKAIYLTVKRYFGLSQKTGPVPPIPKATVDEAAVAQRLAALPEEQRPGLERALQMLPKDVRAALLSKVLAFELPEPPPAIAQALVEATALDERALDGLVARHGADYAAFVAPYAIHKQGFDHAAAEVAGLVGGAEVSTALKGERRGIARAVLKGTVDQPNWDQVKDVVRASVVVPDLRQVGPAVDAFARLYNGRIKIDLDRSGQIVKVPKDRFRRPVGGYYDYMLKIDLGDGRQGEMQFHLPEMLVAKLLGRGHQVYDRMRAMMRLFDHPEHGEAARRHYQQLDVAMRNYYGEVMELARARHGETEMPFLDLSTPYVDSLLHQERKRRGLA